MMGEELIYPAKDYSTPLSPWFGRDSVFAIDRSFCVIYIDKFKQLVNWMLIHASEQLSWFKYFLLRNVVYHFKTV